MRLRPSFGAAYWTVAILSVVYYLIQIAMQMPFLQQETLGLAYSFTGSGRDFWSVIFDPFLIDGGPGRFRFVDYLTQGIYWRLVQHSLLPRELYDWLAITVNLAVCLGILKGIGIFRNWAKWQRWLAMLVFIYGAPTYFVSVFHFRPAKVLTTLWIFLYLTTSLRAQRSNPPNDRGLSVPRMLFLILGALTDPYAILVLTVATLVLSREERSTVRVQEWAAAFGLTLVVILILNGLVGPRFNSSVSLWLSEAPSLGSIYFGAANFLETPLVLADLIGVRGESGWRWAVGTLLWLALAFWLWRGRKATGATFQRIFFFSLPLFAWSVRPSSNPINLFSTYYGHTAYLLFALAWAEMLENGYARLSARPSRALALRQAGAVFTVVLLLSQVTLAVPLYQRWVFDHLEGRRAEVWMKYARDYQEWIRNERTAVEWPPGGREEVLASYVDEKGRFRNATSDGAGRFPHTALYYLLGTGSD